MNLNEIEARGMGAKDRADKATPGPWEGQGKTGVDPIAFNYTFDEDYNIYPPNTTETLGYQVGGPLAVFSHPEDALFCMAAREDIPALADDVLALVERVKLFQEALEKIVKLGQVCDGYELCQHRACTDPAEACQIALNTLYESEKAGSDGQG